jgi:hypothetical protein
VKVEIILVDDKNKMIRRTRTHRQSTKAQLYCTSYCTPRKKTYDLETTGATANDEADFDATAFPPKRGDEAVNAEALAVKRAAAITNFILMV